MVTDVWLPADLADTLTESALYRAPLYELLSDAGVVADRVRHEITAEIAGPRIAQLLDTAIGAAVAARQPPGIRGRRAASPPVSPVIAEPQPGADESVGGRTGRRRRSDHRPRRAPGPALTNESYTGTNRPA